MKELGEIQKIKILDDTIEVTRYLTYAQIQAITNKVCQFDNWADREEIVDMSVLRFATSLSDEEIMDVGHDVWVQTGIMDKVRNNIKNFDRIKECVEYTQSTQRALAQILKELPDMLEPLKESVKRNGSKE